MWKIGTNRHTIVILKDFFIFTNKRINCVQKYSFCTKNEFVLYYFSLSATNAFRICLINVNKENRFFWFKVTSRGFSTKFFNTPRSFLISSYPKKMLRMLPFFSCLWFWWWISLYISQDCVVSFGNVARIPCITEEDAYFFVQNCPRPVRNHHSSGFTNAGLNCQNQTPWRWHMDLTSCDGSVCFHKYYSS